MEHLQNHIEAIIFCNQEAITVLELQECMQEAFDIKIKISQIEEALVSLEEKYTNDLYPFMIFNVGGGYQFLTKPAYQNSISILLKNRSQKKLSTSALETLSIIAYKQPVTKGQIEQIRGVNCDYAVQKLLEKELVELKGKADTVGKPMLYGTSPKFMDYFGINSLNELPQLKDFQVEDNTIGEENEA